MTFTPFDLEQWQSLYETTVKYNLADSGVQPVTLGELVSTPDAVEQAAANSTALSGGERDGDGCANSLLAWIRSWDGERPGQRAARPKPMGSRSPRSPSRAIT